MSVSRHGPLLAVLGFLVSTSPSAGAAGSPMTPAAAHRSPPAYDAMARDLFAQLVGIDSTHAIGSAKAAEMLAAKFKAAGFSGEDIFVGGPRPDKMNIVVRMKGRGRGRPVLFNAHLDVVEAIRETWSTDPFQLVEKDGFFYGRGAIDIKNEDAVLATNLIRLKKEHYRPDRDIILVFNTDEEAGGDANGVEWLLQNHRELVDAGLVINHDAGGGESLNGARLWNTIQTAEKVYATYTLTTAGSGGHSSIPPRDNAIDRLARALIRLDEYSFPVRLTETTRKYLEAVADHVGADRATAIRSVLADPSNKSALDTLRDVPVVNAQLRTTCPVTLVQAGQSESALPIRAKATVQCRLLPGTTAEEMLDTFRRVMDDPQVEIGVVWAPQQSAPATLDPHVVDVVSRVTADMWPGVKTVPVMSAGASDNVYWRAGGLETFGVSGAFVDVNDNRAHGKDERIGVDQFYESLEFSYRLMKALSVKSPASR
jgi:acetylornithine deacetylase/succinyl-diaminopimelate desuccinylase-like protein